MENNTILKSNEETISSQLSVAIKNLATKLIADNNHYNYQNEIQDIVLVLKNNDIELNPDVFLNSTNSDLVAFYNENFIFMDEADILKQGTKVRYKDRDAIIMGDDRENSLVSLSDLNYYIAFSDTVITENKWYDILDHYSTVEVI